MLKVAWESKTSETLEKMMSYNLLLLRWLGVGFRTEMGNTKIKSVLLNLFWWPINLAALGVFVYHQFPFLFESNVSPNASTIIGPLNYAVHSFLAFVGIWWLSRFHSATLWRNLIQMGHYINYSPEDILHCRRATRNLFFTIFGVMLLHVGTTIIDMVWSLAMNEFNWNDFFFLVSLVPYIYSITASVLFINFGRIVQVSFKILALELKQKRPLSCLSISEYELKFSIVSQVAVDLQNAFTFILFVTVSYTFIGFIIASYRLFIFFQKLPEMTYAASVYYKMIQMIYFISEHLVRLWFICHTPDEIHSEAYSLVPVLQNIRNELYIQRWSANADSEEIHAFILEVSETCPTFEIYGMFTLTKQIIISLVGTTLTYLVVLSQFSTNTSTTKTT